MLWAALPFFQSRLGFGRQPQPQHVDADLARRRRGLSLQRRRHAVPGIFPHQFRGHGGTVPVYFEAAAVIVALVFLGQVLELRARERTGSAIRALLDLAPKTARRIGADGSRRRRAARRGQAGDRLRVRPGDAVPVDGIGARRPLVGRRIA